MHNPGDVLLLHLHKHTPSIIQISLRQVPPPDKIRSTRDDTVSVSHGRIGFVVKYLQGSREWLVEGGRVPWRLTKTERGALLALPIHRCDRNLAPAFSSVKILWMVCLHSITTP